MRNFLLMASTLAVAATSLATPLTPAFAREETQREWRGKDGRLHCRRSDGTIGLVVGGAAGALVGRSIDTHGDRTVGTVIGAGAGALIGHEIASKRRCR